MGLGALAAVAMALPSQAAAKPTASITNVSAGNCTLNVTYEWSGFGSARGGTARIELQEGGIGAGAKEQSPIDSSGTFTQQFPNLNGGSYSITGLLVNRRGFAVKGSVDTDGPVTVTCT